MERHKDRVFKHLVPFQRVLLYFLSFSSSHIFLQLDTHLPLSAPLASLPPTSFCCRGQWYRCIQSAMGKITLLPIQSKEMYEGQESIKTICLFAFAEHNEQMYFLLPILFLGH